MLNKRLDRIFWFESSYNSIKREREQQTAELDRKFKENNLQLKQSTQKGSAIEMGEVEEEESDSDF